MKSMFDVLWGKKIFIALGGMFGLVLGVVFLIAVPPKYTSSMLIAPATHGVSSLSDSSSRGLSLSGALLGNLQNPDFTRILALMHSEAVADRLQKRYGIIQKLYPSLWDSERSTWVRPSGPLSRLSQWLNRSLGRREWQEPDAQFLADILAKNIRIEISENKGIFKVSFTAKSPELAALILSKTYEDSEAIAREDALKTTNAYVQYLDNEMKGATQQSTKQGLTDLYIQQQQRKMVLSADVPFAADVVSPPTPRQRPAGFGPFIILVLGALGGVATVSGLSLLLNRHAGQKPAGIDRVAVEPAIGSDDFHKIRNYN